ncbi:MAG: sensor histidine kinase [Egibacteraceae bacterium]
MTTSTSHPDDLQLALRRVVLGYRVVAVIWLAVLAVAGLVTGTVRGPVAAAVLLTVTVWTLASFALARRPHPWSSWVWLALDTAIAVAVTLAPLAGGPVPGGYPFSAVVFAVYAHGFAGALLAAVPLALASAARIGAVGDGLSLATALETGLFWIAAGLVLAWGVRVLLRTEEQRRAAESALADERMQRARSQERAETAAHLHDSVLQTLALIQRRAGGDAEASTLARRQEHELRQWLRDGAASGDAGASFKQTLARMAADVEEAHGFKVQVITVGDTVVDERLEALVGATREALVNAAVHANVDEASVYGEVVPDAVRVFVRDRGRGFDPAAVSPDRRGLSQSIVGRLQRRGGSSDVRTVPGRGVEWELRMPRSGNGSGGP